MFIFQIIRCFFKNTDTERTKMIVVTTPNNPLGKVPYLCADLGLITIIILIDCNDYALF